MGWKFRAFTFVFFLSRVSLGCDYAALRQPFDHGPDPKTKNGRDFIDHIASLPPLPTMSPLMLGLQKFRAAFGPLFYRLSDGRQQGLFMGQDGVHKAESSFHTATAAFGGDAQKIVNYLGMHESAGFFNAFPYTIFGQYGVRDAPYIYEKDGKREIRRTTIVDNHLWTMTHEGPHAAWNKGFYEIMIKQHPEMRMLVDFGGAAQDATATFLKSVGVKVPTKISEREMKFIQVPEMKEVSAGGNNTFGVLLGSEGQDLYSEFLGRKLNYKLDPDRLAATEALDKNVDWFYSRMVFSKGGPYGNGILHPAQLGGHKLTEMKVNGEKTVSLKGVTLSDGTKIENHLLVPAFPHPTALGFMKREGKDPGKVVQKQLSPLQKYVADGWHIEADPGQKNHFEAGDPFEYGRTDLSTAYYHFGTPGTRMQGESNAIRMSGKPYAIIDGIKGKAEFDMKALEAIRHSKPSDEIDPQEQFNTRARGPESRYDFDPGPSVEMANLMKDNLDLKAIFTPKPGKTWKKDGIAAFNVKNHPDVKDFGHYRGRLENPKVLILADPVGVDEFVTGMAMSGARGQYLNGLMHDVGVKDDYLVLRTVPFRMDGATDTEWAKVMSQTQTYRDKVIAAVLNQKSSPDLIIADGPRARAELERILGKDDPRIVNIQRGEGNYGIQAAGKEILKRDGYQGKITGKMKDIPRSHFPFLTRVASGRGGDSVLAATDKNEGLAYAVVLPEWVTEQTIPMTPEQKAFVDGHLTNIQRQGLRLPGETVPEFLARRQREQASSAP